MPVINVPPQPPMSDYEKTNFAIEVAFNNLIQEAQKLGLPIAAPMGLMYLPTEKLTSDFQTACKAILDSLKMPVS